MKEKLAGLDVLRVMAACGIMAYHYFFIGVIQGFYSNDVFLPIAFWGELGVDVFFLLSGFLILNSTHERTTKEFLIARAKRIYPTFIIASGLTVVTGILMPGTEPAILLRKWGWSLTFFGDVIGVSPLSSIYWTLMVEVKFYILVAIVMKSGCWKQHKHKLLTSWLMLAVLNCFVLHNEWMNVFLNTKYAGHFCLGILLYMIIIEREWNDAMFVQIPICIWLIYCNVLSYTQWIRGIYDQLPHSDIDILFGLIVLMGAFLFSARIGNVASIVKEKAAALNRGSYAFYLVHADFGYFIRTQYYNRMVVRFPVLLNLINEWMIMLAAIAFSLLMAWFVYKSAGIASYYLNRLEKRE